MSASPWVRVTREPLVRFLVIGCAIFAADRALAGARDAPGEVADAREIPISPALVEALRTRQRERDGRPPDAAATEALVRAFVREEALVREARAARLDVTDTVVRRRLVQKMEFLVAAQVVVPEPTDEELRAWMDAHRRSIEAPGATRFEHVFFSAERRGDAAERDAAEALAAIEGGAEPGPLGDLFVRGRSFGPVDDARIDAAFGAGFAARLCELPRDAWVGPVPSAHGQHLVRVVERRAARMPELAEVRDRIVPSWSEERRTHLADEELERIVSRYRVVRDSP
ncbi:MAG: peptidyl-prolyl cis-trans isomerase [Sandaracinaceae bacterium]